MLNKTGAGTQHPMHFSCAPARSHTDNKQRTNSKLVQAAKGREGRAAVRKQLYSNSAPPVSARLCTTTIRRRAKERAPP